MTTPSLAETKTVVLSSNKTTLLVPTALRNCRSISQQIPLTPPHLSVMAGERETETGLLDSDLMPQ